MSPLTFVTWRWAGHTMGHTRPDYGAHHVNVMAAMIRRNTTLDHEIICVTDDPEGIDKSIRTVPLWNDLRSHGRCFVRLKAFMPEMREILGEKIVSLDLDTVITRNIDHVFNRDEDFMAWSDPSRITPYCGSQWMVKPGEFPEVFTEFDIEEHKKLKPEKGYFGSDQAWLAHKLPGRPVWTRADGVYSFRMHILKEGRRRRPLCGLPAEGSLKLPDAACIVHFHGIYDPSQSVVQERMPWVRDNWRI